jgi:hypothetical protein
VPTLAGLKVRNCLAGLCILSVSLSVAAGNHPRRAHARTLVPTFRMAQTEDISTAEALASAGNFESAFPIFQRLAAQGDAIAKYKLAEMYYRGLGVPPDHGKAANLFEAAAEQNIMNAQQNLAVMYANGDGVTQDYARAVYWFRKAALQGDPLAQLSLGYRYERGQGVEQDYKQALDWYKKSADQNHPQAAYEIARLYGEGKGVQKDLKLWVAWLTKAAEAGYPQAERKLGFAYLTGSGVKRDWVEAYKWLVIFEEQTGAPLDLNNPNWEPGIGSVALRVREQFKTLMSPKQIREAEEATRRWRDVHH